MRRVWRNFVALGMFATRTVAFFTMVALQRTVGGAEIKTPKR